jgi:hypothetical protein
MNTHLPRQTGERISGSRGSRSGWWLVYAALGAAACTGGSISQGGSEPSRDPSAPSQPGDSTRPPAAGGSTSMPGGQPPAAAKGEVKRVPIHRLNNREYDNTMRDLLGVASTGAKSFINDEQALGFDTIADAFGMTPAQYEQYFNSADALVDQVFADAALRGRILICAPTGGSDVACMGRIVSAFGLRAWRRPLTEVEVARLVKVATDNIAMGDDVVTGVKQSIKAILSSLSFLYRIEIDPDPKSLKARPLDGYELASRLSYLAWSTMPDDTLFALAKSGELTKEATLTAQLDRMLGDTRSSNFVNSFAGQWLGVRDLQGHQVDPAAFPMWNEPLRQAMAQEAILYFQEFLFGGRNMKEFLTADVNFVNGPLAALYGVSGGAGDQLTKVNNTTDARHGFLGLAGFLTLTSFPYRTAPTLRGKWVLENLLCEELPPPPVTVPDLDTNTPMAMAQSQNVRVRLEQHRADPACAACHALLDPIGMGLENFDAIGRYRTKYTNGDAVDSSGVLPDKSTFSNLAELTAILAKTSEKQLLDCASKMLMTYTLSRAVESTDGPYLDQIRKAWNGGDMKTLLKQIVLSETFRFRQADPQ